MGMAHQWARAHRNAAAVLLKGRQRPPRPIFDALAFVVSLALVGVMVAAALTGCSAPRATADAGDSLVLSAKELGHTLDLLERATVPGGPEATEETPAHVARLRLAARGHVAAIGTVGVQLQRLGRGGK